MTPITSRTDWSPELLEAVWKEIEIIAIEELELVPGRDLYTNQFEIVSAEQMLDAYSSIGLPVHYNHWSFGKDFMQQSKQYEKGQMGLAYEMVINSNPCVNLLMEENLAYMQTMVMAHAGVGHNAVFKNNVYFKEWTQAGSIMDYMMFARDYIQQCEERYGLREVEHVLDAAHALAAHGIDKFKRKHQPILSEEQRLKKLMVEDDRRQRELDVILKKTTIVGNEDGSEEAEVAEEFMEADEENLLYFIMKKSPNLERWKREILRIVYKVNQYFSPQGPTKTLNEGMATFCHHYIMERLEEKGIVTSDAFMAYLASHSGVVFQPGYNSKYYSGPNPYALGFAILQDVKRICEGGEWSHKSKGSKFTPITDEDRRWFPELLGRKWQDVIKEACFEHREDSFIMQYLLPKVIRDLKLFTVSIQYDGEEGDEINPLSATATVAEIHDDVGYANIRTALARSKERVNYVPQIVVEGADLEGDRTLYLRYDPYMDRELDEDDANEVLGYLDSLWGYTVNLTT